MAETEQRSKDSLVTNQKDTMVKQEKRENLITNGGKGSGDDADSLEEMPLDIGEHYLVRRSDDSWRKSHFHCLQLTTINSCHVFRIFGNLRFVYLFLFKFPLLVFIELIDL